MIHPFVSAMSPSQQPSYITADQLPAATLETFSATPPTKLTLVLANLLLLGVACHRHAEAAQPPVCGGGAGTGTETGTGMTHRGKAFLLVCFGSQGGLSSEQGQVEFNLWPT